MAGTAVPAQRHALHGICAVKVSSVSSERDITVRVTAPLFYFRAKLLRTFVPPAANITAVGLCIFCIRVYQVPGIK